jgi:hypothetical protein
MEFMVEAYMSSPKLPGILAKYRFSLRIVNDLHAGMQLHCETRFG